MGAVAAAGGPWCAQAIASSGASAAVNGSSGVIAPRANIEPFVTIARDCRTPGDTS
jgi:hypothetical protein